MSSNRALWLLLMLVALALPACGGDSGKKTNKPQNAVDKAAAADDLLREAIAAEQAGQPNVAETKYKRALKLRPAHYETAERYTRFLIAQGQARDAVQVANNYLTRSLNDLKGYHLAADAYIADKDWIKAYETITELIGLDEGDGRAWEKRGTIQVMREDYSDALENLRKAVSLDPDNADFYASLGSALQRAGKPAEAAIELRKAIKLDDGNARGHLILGVVLRAQGEYRDALKHHQRAGKLAPNDARVNFELGVSQNFNGDNSAAEISLKRATDLEPGDPLNWYALGEVLRNMQRYKEAVAPYRTALELDPGYAKAAEKLGVVLYYAGELGEAEIMLTERVKNYPKEPYAYFNLGQVYAKQEKYALAVESFERFIALAPKEDGDVEVAKKKVRELKRKVRR
jgi:tetratricopeptide (TPR) repeat protein